MTKFQTSSEIKANIKIHKLITLSSKDLRSLASCSAFIPSRASNLTKFRTENLRLLILLEIIKTTIMHLIQY
jgi:hypothetical protein